MTSDAYHELDSQWRSVRDLESLRSSQLSGLAGELLTEASSDPRCQRLRDGEIYRLVSDAVDGDAYLIPGLLSFQDQAQLLSALICDWATPPNRSNLWPAEAPESGEWLQEGLAKFFDMSEDSPDPSSLSVIEKLRWVTMGKQYDWSSRCYLPDDCRPLPELLVSFATRAVDLLKDAGEIDNTHTFQAAICNLYHAARRPSDRLGGHRDDVEEDTTSPLVTISIGLPCVFLLGKETRSSKPIPLLLTAGSMLVLTNRARQAYHGVPTILVPPKLQMKGRTFRRASPASWDPTFDWAYRPWLVANDSGGAPPEPFDSTVPEAIHYLLTRARVSFSIRSVDVKIPAEESEQKILRETCWD
ncbi:unnamed protein product [Cladocopium goreaui]|uniref:Alpha-ketoglutarate-dependent dioxygenase abh1 n=1 Tax=Cladocopium goreaui TaxID=2562237 RepID=A0A9P1FGC7_9DINO|nr:unnamed protein product [Cladocopium goreaui]